MSTWVISPCKRSRVDELRTMVTSLGVDRRFVVIVGTYPDPIRFDDVKDFAFNIVHFNRPGMLFGEWFNLGFDYIASQETDEKSEVLCIGSSLIGTPDLIPALRSALRGCELTMVGPDLFGRVHPHDVDIQRRGDQRTLHNRVLANCFMVAAEHGLRFDPEFRWWYSDDDLEMQARQIGPVGNVGGVPITMTHPDGHYLSEEQAIWATEDRVKFVAKWGQQPW